jgi:hypothetical protein
VRRSPTNQSCISRGSEYTGAVSTHDKHLLSCWSEIATSSAVVFAHVAGAWWWIFTVSFVTTGWRMPARQQSRRWASCERIRSRNFRHGLIFAKLSRTEVVLVAVANQWNWRGIERQMCNKPTGSPIQISQGRNDVIAFFKYLSSPLSSASHKIALFSFEQKTFPHNLKPRFNSLGGTLIQSFYWARSC